MRYIRAIRSRILSKFKGDSALKAGFGYTIGNYLLKGIGFLTMPIFSRLLTIDDFGRYNTFMAYESVIYLFVGLALHASIKNAKYQYGDGLDPYVSSASLLQFIVLVVLYVAIVPFLSILQSVLRLSLAEVLLLPLLGFCTSALFLFQSRVAVDYRVNEYLRLSYFNTIASVVLSIVLISFFYADDKYMGRILGTAIPLVLIAGWILATFFRKARPKVNKEYWKYGLGISLPIIPHGVGQVLLASFDRIMISLYIGDAEAGYYSFAYTIYTIILVAGNSLGTVFEPWAFEQIGNGKMNELRKRGTQFMLLLAGLCALAMLAAPEIVLVLGSEKYLPALPAIPPVLFGGFFAMVYTIPCVAEYYYKKTKYIALGTAVATILNVALNVILIPRFGYVAAAYSTLISYAAYFLFHSILSRKFLGEYIMNIGALAGVIAVLSAVAVLATLCQDNTFVRYAAIVMIALLFCIRKKL